MSLDRVGVLLILIAFVLLITTLLSALGLGLLTMLGLHDGTVPVSLGYPLVAAGVSFLLGGLFAVIELLISVWRYRP